METLSNTVFLSDEIGSHPHQEEKNMNNLQRGGFRKITIIELQPEEIEDAQDVVQCRP